jgi:hypothetical protein
LPRKIILAHSGHGRPANFDALESGASADAKEESNDEYVTNLRQKKKKGQQQYYHHYHYYQ